MTAVDAASRWPAAGRRQLWFKDEPVTCLVVASKESTRCWQRAPAPRPGSGEAICTSRLRAPGCSVACPQASTPGPACHQVLPPCTVPSFSPLSPLQTLSFVLEATPRAAPVSKQTPLSVVLAPGSWLLAASPGPNLPRGSSASPLLSGAKASCSSKATNGGRTGCGRGATPRL